MRICGDLNKTPFLRQNHRRDEMQTPVCPSIQTSTSYQGTPRSWFLPPNPPVSSREEAMRAWSLRVVGAPRLDCSCFASFVSHWRPNHACSLTASFFCSVGGSVACKTPSFNGVVWGAVSSRQNSTLRRGTQVMFLQCQ